MAFVLKLQALEAPKKASHAASPSNVLSTLLHPDCLP
jgi:hypothetical protein